MVYFDQILHTYACQHCLTTGMHYSFLLIDKALSNINQAGYGQLVKMLIPLEPDLNQILHINEPLRVISNNVVF